MIERAASKHLLVIWHSRTGASKAMARAAHDAAPNSRLLRADEVTGEDLLAACAYLFVCPENLGTMSGLMKEMFDRTYYDVLGQIEGRSFASIIAAGSDGAGAQRQLERIVTGWRLKRVAEPVIVNFDAQSPEEIAKPKIVPDKVLKDCHDLGLGLAEGVAMGLF